MTDSASRVHPGPRSAAFALLPEMDQRPVRRRRIHHRLVIWLSVLLSAAVVAGAFVASFRYYASIHNYGPQIATQAPPAAPGDLAAYQAFAADAPATPPAPIVLAYHDLTTNTDGSRYAITPKRFDAEMRMLKKSGYTTITGDQFVSYLKGDWHPTGRTVLLTFDDGAAGLWTYADKTLKRYGFDGVTFVITGDVSDHQPYYLTWPEIVAMSESGRWSFGSHTNALHDRVASGSDGKRRPSLTNRLNLGGTRVETLPAFTKRVKSDLAKSKSELTDHGLPAPQLFAWPFSALVHKATDPDAARIARGLVRQMFVANFTNPANTPQPATRRAIASGTIQRLEVMRSTTARELFSEMAAMETVPPSAAAKPLTVDKKWMIPSGEAAKFTVHGDTLQPTNPTSTYVRLDWAPQRTADWQNYAVSATVTGLDSTVNTTGGLRVRVGSAAETALRVSANQASVQDAAGKRLGTFKLTPGSRHTLKVQVRSGSTEFFVDGATLMTVPAKTGPLMTGGFGVVSGRAKTSVPFPAYSGLAVSVPTGS